MIETLHNVSYKANGRGPSCFDCYGLVKHLYKQEHGVDIVDFDYENPNDPENEHHFFDSLENPRWIKVERQKGAVVALRVNGYISHCGFMIDAQRFIHIMESTGVAMGNVNSPHWKSRVVGYYRYD